ncbi:MAG TPA: hemerythrin domain-containing protein, partial [bacterium]|nr:hemerythrin domain-containing protein [bacterium]
QLIGYILFTHHDFAEKEFPRLERLLAEAVREGSGHPDLLEMKEQFRHFREFFSGHMREEEKYFFPFFLMLSADSGTPPLSGESMERLVRIMESEHREVDGALSRIREKTRGYHIPLEAGPRLRQLMEGLKFLEAELQRHARVETRVLFPKVTALEARRQKSKN